MDRIYSTEESNNVNFFIGQEIENTTFKNYNTLFVVGNQTTNDILEKIEIAKDKHSFAIEHLYFAANHSYDVFDQFQQLQEFIDLGFNVTYETINTNVNESLIKKLPLDSRRFNLMISVVLPDIGSYQARSTIKLDDNDTNRKNPGVYCYNLSKLVMDEESFTSWNQYGNDIII